MQIAVCDDSALDREIISELIALYFSERALPCEIAPYASGTALLSAVQTGKLYDIVFLDIFMDELLGIDVAKKLREVGFGGSIVFLTASAAFAVDSYDVGASGYLLKPHSYEKLRQVLTRIVGTIESGVYCVQRRSGVVRIPYDEIVYAESDNSKCTLYRSDGTDYVVYKRLADIEKELDDERFLRCHQSYLVNMAYIDHADKAFSLKTGEIIPIRQRQLKLLRDAYLSYADRRSRQRRLASGDDAV